MSGMDPGSVIVPGGGGASPPTGTGYRRVTGGVEDAAAYTAAQVAADLGVSATTVYTFASATGVTLTDRSGTAAVTGGVLRLASTVRTDVYTATLTSPEGSVSAVQADGRCATRTRATVRVAAITPAAGVSAGDVIAYLCLSTRGATVTRYVIYVSDTGDLHAERNDTGPTLIGDLGGGVAAAALAAGDLLLEIEADGALVVARYSLDDGVTWADLGSIVLAAPLGGIATARCLMHTGAPVSGSTVVDFDDLAVTVWP